MRSSIIGMVVGIIIAFLCLVVSPIYHTSIINWRDDMNTAQTAARNFVDKVIDTGEISDITLTDLNLMLATCTCSFDYEIWRETKVVNPAGAGRTYTTWQQVEIRSDTLWETGDIVTIEIRQTSQGIFQRLAAGFFNTTYSNRVIRLSGMVR